jgi:hypothetical protein
VSNYDPVAKAYIAEGTPQHPVGTLDELETHRLPKNVFYSCSEPSADGGLTNKGCPVWYQCNMSYKGQTLAEGGGPRSHCWERMKAPENGAGIVRNVLPCYFGVAQQEALAVNTAMGIREIFQPIKDEGETYEMLTTVPVPEKGRDQYGYLVYEERLLEMTVQPFERLGQAKKMARHELRSSIIEREKKKVESERVSKALGIAGNDTPLDKRGHRGSKGAGKEGGSKPEA